MRPWHGLCRVQIPTTHLSRNFAPILILKRGEGGSHHHNLKSVKMNRREEYIQYLQSQKWKGKVAELTRKCGGKRCSVCHATFEIDTHHRTYARIFDELIDDLVFLCRKHHFEEHERNKLPKPWYPKHRLPRAPKSRKTKSRRFLKPLFGKVEEAKCV